MKQNQYFFSPPKTKNFLKVISFSLFVFTPFLFLKNHSKRKTNSSLQHLNSHSIYKNFYKLNLDWLWGIPTALSWVTTAWSLTRGLGNVFKTIKNYTGYIYGYSAAIFGVNLSNSVLLRRLNSYTRDVVFKNPNYRVQPQKVWYFPVSSYSLPQSISRLDLKVLPDPLSNKN